jgi:CubicO group peptidase (beta-lactamase class C family)
VADVVEWIEGLMEEHQVPGVVVGTWHRGEVAVDGRGITNVDHPLPVTPETFFQIGSITKTFTGTAVMRLIEQGKMELGARVREYVRDFRVADETASEEATVRHLLTHTADWVGDYFEDTGSGDDALARYVSKMAELEQLAPLGTAWSYCNSGFTLLGALIERVMGTPYEEALEELVLAPLHLDCVFFDPGDVMTYRFAVGHQFSDNGPEVARPWPLPRYAYPSGGITCTAGDLLRYAAFHLGDGRTPEGQRLLGSDSLTATHAPQVNKWVNEAWGLAWAVDRADGTWRVYHGGGTTGQVSLLTLVPEEHFAIVVLTNGNRGERITTAVTRRALKERLGIEIPEPAPIESPAERLSGYAGRYVGWYSDVELSMREGKLEAQVTYKRGFPKADTPLPPNPHPVEAVLCEEDRLLALEEPFKGATADVIRRDDGSIGWLRFSGRLHRRADT